MQSIDQHKEDLLREFNQVLKDAEEFLSHSEQQVGEKFNHAKDKLETTIKNAKAELERVEEVVVRKAKDSAHATDQFVHENPWKTAGIAAGIGLLIGLLISKNK